LTKSTHFDKAFGCSDSRKVEASNGGVERHSFSKELNGFSTWNILQRDRSEIGVELEGSSDWLKVERVFCALFSCVGLQTNSELNERVQK
jgi:hypothetical protein